MRRYQWLCLLLVWLLLTAGCSDVRPEAASEPAPEPTAAAPTPAATPKRTASTRRDVDILEAYLHEDLAEGNDAVRLDLSAVSEGYFAVSGTSETRLKVQLLKDETTYTYDIETDGTPSVFPLQSGDGTYTVRIMENVVDSKYAELYSATCDVVLDDEFQPFLRPNDYVNYDADSACVQMAAELAEGAADHVAVVAAVYEYICESVVYDTSKAETVQSGYIPDPDETLRTGQGICFDYASLAAAMLRSQGIPTKLIFGYVSPDGLYHAWNMFYTDVTGWVTVDFEVSGESWNRIDLTFAANGADNEFIGDGGNYSDLYYY